MPAEACNQPRMPRIDRCEYVAQVHAGNRTAGTFQQPVDRAGCKCKHGPVDAILDPCRHEANDTRMPGGIEQA